MKKGVRMHELCDSIFARHNFRSGTSAPCLCQRMHFQPLEQRQRCYPVGTAPAWKTCPNEQSLNIWSPTLTSNNDPFLKKSWGLSKSASNVLVAVMKATKGGSLKNPSAMTSRAIQGVLQQDAVLMCACARQMGTEITLLGWQWTKRKRRTVLSSTLCQNCRKNWMAGLSLPQNYGLAR